MGVPIVLSLENLSGIMNYLLNYYSLIYLINYSVLLVLVFYQINSIAYSCHFVQDGLSTMRMETVLYLGGMKWTAINPKHTILVNETNTST